MELLDDFKTGQSDNIPEGIHRALKYMVENFSDELNLDELSEVAQVTKFNLCRNFRRRYGIPPMRWLWVFRVLLAGEFIKLAPDWSLTDIAFTCGFSSSAHFSRSFSGVMKKSPSSFRRNLTKTTGVGVANAARKTTYDLMFQDNSKLVSNAFNRMLTQQYLV